MVLGGKIVFPSLTLQLQKDDIVKYQEMKVAIWLHMLNDRMIPTKWFNSNKNGTGVNFDSIRNQMDYDKGLALLKVHTKYINEEYGTDMHFGEN